MWIKHKKLKKLNLKKPGGSVFLNSLKTACARNLNAEKLFGVSDKKLVGFLH